MRLAGGGNRHAGCMTVKVQNSSINLQEYPLSLIDRGRRLSSGTALQHTLVLVIPFQKLLLDLSLLFFFVWIKWKKKKKDKSRIAGQQLTTRAWQTSPCFFFVRNCHVSLNVKDALLFCWVVQCKSTTKSMKMCLESREKNRTEVHVYAHDQCQANLSMGWLVCSCITIFHEVITIFLAVLCRPNTFWSMYPGTVWCTQVLRNAILKKKKKEKHCYQYKDFNHRCKDGYILGKTPVSLPITTGYSLPPTWNRFRQKKAVELLKIFGLTEQNCTTLHWIPSRVHKNVLMYSWSHQEYIRTRVCNTTHCDLARRNFK